MSREFLSWRQHGGIVTLTMQEPATRNALSGNTAVDEFVAACERLQRDESVRVAIVTGADPAFCAGGNLDAMRADWRDRKQATSVRQQLRSGVQRLGLALHALEVPLIAAVNGPAIGGGCDLACMCDMRIASEHAKFSANFVKLGIVPALGGAWLLTRIVGASKAAEMCLTGEVLDASAAQACGLVSRVVPHGELMDSAMVLALQIAAHSAPALRMTKNLLRASGSVDLPAYLDMAASMQAVALQSSEHELALTALVRKSRP